MRSWLFYIHSHFSGGHLRMFKTHLRVLQKLWWPGIFEDVKTFISNCEICIKVKPLGKRRAKLGYSGVPNKPMNVVSIDYLTELPLSQNGEVHMMVFNDHFSKFIQVYPVPDRTAKTASVISVDYILRFGSSVKLYSDKDKSYESELFQHVSNIMGSKKMMSTPYNPRANGLTEQSNGTIKN